MLPWLPQSSYMIARVTMLALYCGTLQMFQMMTGDEWSNVTRDLFGEDGELDIPVRTAPLSTVRCQQAC